MNGDERLLEPPYEQRDSAPTRGQRDYEPPRLIDLGTLGELTLGVAGSSNTDAQFGSQFAPP